MLTPGIIICHILLAMVTFLLVYAFYLRSGHKTMTALGIVLLVVLGASFLVGGMKSGLAATALTVLYALISIAVVSSLARKARGYRRGVLTVKETIREAVELAAATPECKREIEEERNRPCRRAIEAALEQPEILQLMFEFGLTPEDLAKYYDWTRGAGIDPSYSSAAVRNPEILRYYFSRKGNGPMTPELFLRIVPWITNGERPVDLKSEPESH